MPLIAKSGPDLPVELIEAREEGEVVVFAGAGVSLPAGMPDFKGLVEYVQSQIPDSKEVDLMALFDQEQYDRMLGTMEERFGALVREKVIECLTCGNPSAEVHQGLLEVARYGTEVRLVTTNFDHLFVKAAAATGLVATGRITAGPQLPVPRKAHWNGIVHLHGLIDTVDDPAGKNLILTSADFGRAYLVDGWASRFVTELMRSFHILFVGYGLNDPVMRYLMDALAKERARDKAGFKEAFALVGVEGCGQEDKTVEHAWSQKGVTPVFYDSSNEHEALYSTLRTWADLSRGGLRTRMSWALRHADQPPANPQDDEARLVAWALSDSSGAVAHAWAAREPAPDIGWLKIFDEQERERRQAAQGNHRQLVSDGLGLLAAPQLWSTLPLVVGVGPTDWSAPLSLVGKALAAWLVNCLDSRDLLDWVLEKGGVLHPVLRERIRWKLRKGQEVSEPFRSVWSVLASEHYTNRKLAIVDGSSVRSWLSATQERSSDLVQRREFIRALSVVPSLTVSSMDPLKSLVREVVGAVGEEPRTPGDLVSCKLEFAGDDAEELIRAVGAGLELPWGEVAHEFSHHLEEAMEWLSFFGEADCEKSYGHIGLPSISPHAQNQPLHAWQWLMLLNGRSIAALTASGSVSEQLTAYRLLLRWREIPSPVFRRLTLHAATVGGTSEEFDWRSDFVAAGVRLLLQNWRALWGSEEKREALRFLRKCGDVMTEAQVGEIVREVRKGPPRGMFIDDLQDAKFQVIKQKMVWHRLARLEESGVVLSDDARNWLNHVRRKLEVSVPPEDEFTSRSVELGPHHDEEREQWREEVRSRPDAALNQLIAQVQQSPASFSPQNCSLAFYEWAIVGWPTADAQPCLALRRVADELLPHCSDDDLEKILAAVSHWYDTMARARDSKECEPEFHRLFKFLYPLAQNETIHPEQEPVSLVLNHPAGLLSTGLLQRLWRSGLRPGDGLPEPYENLLSMVVSTHSAAGRISKVALAMDLGSLHALDAEWTQKHLLPRFRWNGNEEEAAALWRSFLWRPGAGLELIHLLKQDFLMALDRIDQEERASEQAVRHLIFWSIEWPDLFTQEQITRALATSPERLLKAAKWLKEFVQFTDKPADLWKHKIGPWFEKHWPRHREMRTPEVAAELAALTIWTGTEFPQALETVRGQLVQTSPQEVLRLLTKEETEDEESRHRARYQGAAPPVLNLPEQYPEEVLDLLELSVSQDMKPWHRVDLREVLDRIRQATPQLAEDHRFERLDRLTLVVE